MSKKKSDPRINWAKVEVTVSGSKKRVVLWDGPVTKATYTFNRDLKAYYEQEGQPPAGYDEHGVRLNFFIANDGYTKRLPWAKKERQS